MQKGRANKINKSKLKSPEAAQTSGDFFGDNGCLCAMKKLSRLKGGSVEIQGGKNGFMLPR